MRGAWWQRAPGPLGNGLLHHRLGIFSRLDHVVGADGHSSGQGLLQILPAQVMGAGPGAVHRVALVDESDMDVVGPYSVQEPVQEPLSGSSWGRCSR